MSTDLSKMVELNDAELDAVAAGALIAVGAIVVNDTVDVGDVSIPVTLNEVVKNVGIGVAVAAGIIGAAGAAASGRG